MPPLKLALKVSKRLFKRFFEEDLNARLNCLEVCFKHQEMSDRAQTNDVKHPIRVRRLGGDGASSPLEGGFRAESPGRWLNVILIVRGITILYSTLMEVDEAIEGGQKRSPIVLKADSP